MIKNLYKIYRIDKSYYAFVSGAVISFALTIIYDAAENSEHLLLWLSGIVMLISSFLLCVCSYYATLIQDEYLTLNIHLEDLQITKTEAWYASLPIKNRKIRIFPLIVFLLFILTFAASIILFIMEK